MELFVDLAWTIEELHKFMIAAGRSVNISQRSPDLPGGLVRSVCGMSSPLCPRCAHSWLSRGYLETTLTFAEHETEIYLCLLTRRQGWAGRFEPAFGCISQGTLCACALYLSQGWELLDTLSFCSPQKMQAPATALLNHWATTCLYILPVKATTESWMTLSQDNALENRKWWLPPFFVWQNAVSSVFFKEHFQ